MARFGQLRFALLLLGAAAAVSFTIPSSRAGPLDAPREAHYHHHEDDVLGRRAAEDGLLLERVLKYTRRQLATSLGGLFQMVRAGFACPD